MFDIGFSEIVVVGVVALVVIGPEKLPRVARTLGHMFGRLQRYVGEVKADITREIELDELRKLQTEVKDAARDFEHSVTNVATEFRSTAREIETQLNSAASGDVASASGATPEPTAATGGQPATSEDGTSAIAAMHANSETLSSSMAPSSSGAHGGISAAPGTQINHASQAESMAPLQEAPADASSPEASEPPRQPTLPGFDRI